MFKEYQSIKKVHADPEPISQADYGNLRAKAVLADPEAATKWGVHPATFRMGHHVIYNMGKDNEYHSWTPVEELATGYIEIKE